MACLEKIGMGLGDQTLFRYFGKTEVAGRVIAVPCVLVWGGIRVITFKIHSVRRRAAQSV